ncbi:MAG TPA: hypothetical protein VH107_12040 [Lacipirellulaceae bacterium]|jgi:hypothetical protein|nr:hypothetical protein [Lacipirellulaceae bacterium]
MKLMQGMRGNRRYAVLSVAAAIAVFVGCRGGSMESEVSGTVTLDGNKIGPGTIVFAPITAHGRPATGSIASDGTYKLETSRDAGLALGSYRVAVSVRKMPENVKRGDRPPPGKLLIPEKYEDDAKSGLQYDVSPGRNTINVELVSK